MNNNDPCFWDSPTLEELAKTQNVTLLEEVPALLGTWPGDVDDGFEAEIDALRHEGVRKEVSGEPSQDRIGFRPCTLRR